MMTVSWRIDNFSLLITHQYLDFSICLHYACTQLHCFFVSSVVSDHVAKKKRKVNNTASTVQESAPVPAVKKHVGEFECYTTKQCTA